MSVAPLAPPFRTIGVVLMVLEKAVAADEFVTENVDPVWIKFRPSVLYHNSAKLGPELVLERLIPVRPLNDTV